MMPSCSSEKWCSQEPQDCWVKIAVLDIGYIPMSRLPKKSYNSSEANDGCLSTPVAEDAP